MKIDFNIDETDFLTHQLYIASKSDRIKKKRQRNRIIVPLIYVALGFLLFFIEEQLDLPIIFFIVALLWYFIYPIWDKQHYVRHYKGFIRENYKDRLGRAASIEFTNDIIIAKDSGSESKVLTKELDEIVEIPTTIFVRLKTGQSFILPIGKIQNIDLLKTRLKELATYLNINYNLEDKWEWK